MVGELVSQGDGQHAYSFTYNQLLSATAYFRIRQIDLDGRATHSSVIRLIASGQGRISLYPNPAQDVVTVTVGNQLLHTVALLYDLHGKQLQSVIITGTAFTIRLKDYPAGIYLLKTSDGQVVRIVKA
ncbi:T9SS type A sorting domain-containing protein [Paraflavitalea speifideaquila]|uniref:T9SS type A sorting domain-containing protein n=1 Tax=Paraflavitalea speifideaquila TaxID=3076558 RepID=UPI0028E63ADA|nr:T9SS type A sorting domain-containing protein [Paraflavitalea speifideiaquila]